MTPYALKELSIKLRAWNKATLNNIFRRKKRKELRLGAVQRAMEMRMLGHIIALEKELREERNLILPQEELL